MFSNDQIPFDILVRNISQDVNDKEFRKGFTRGWYLSKIRECLDELAYETSFDEQPPLDAVMPKDLRFKLPNTIWNIKEVYATNYTSGSGQITDFAPIYFHRHQNNLPYGGAGYTANRSAINDFTNDPFGQLDLEPFIDGYFGDTVLSCNFSAGWLLFSSTCAGYSGFRLVYTGTAGNIDEIPLIPRYFQKCIQDYVKHKYYVNMITREPRAGYAALAQLASNELYDRRMGSWWDAKDRVKKMNTKQRNDFNTYQQRGNW